MNDFYLFNEIVRRWIMTPNGEKQFTYLGVNPNHWPECEAKAIMMRYFDFKNNFSEMAAKSECYSSAKKLIGEEMHEDFDLFKHQYQEKLEEINYKQLAVELARKPQDGKDILRKFREKEINSVEEYDLDLSVEALWTKINEKAKTKENLISLVNWDKLSRGIGGFNTGRISMLVAGTGVGKTTLAINFALAAICSGLKVLFLNQEMSLDDFGSRAIESGSNISHEELISGHVYHAGFEAFKKLLKDKERFIFTNGKSLTLAEIEAKIFIHTSDKKKTLVIIDYDQKILVGNYEDEWQMIRRAVERLENIAKETNSHIMMLAQGDDFGDPKASKRSKQSAATVLHFGKVEEKNLYFVKATKNRFGEKDFSVEVIYDPARASAKEGRILKKIDFEIEQPKPRWKT